ncbi:hypothetical protein MED193_15427 [Roseobacter sp. MED193]|nr:hypothetical protein MED193_15427 [Roseobacter sp. MED193]
MAQFDGDREVTALNVAVNTGPGPTEYFANGFHINQAVSGLFWLLVVHI